MQQTDTHIASYDMSAAELVPQYDAVDMSKMWDWVLKNIDQLPADIGTKRALDVGAGSGRDARLLAGLGYAVTAAEPSKGMRSLGSVHPDNKDIEWIDARLPDLDGIEDNRYDLVLLNAVWQHVDPAQRDLAFDALMRVLTPGGILVLSTRHGPAPAGRPMHEIDIGSIPDQWRRIARQCGSLSSTPLKDEINRGDVQWVVWMLTKTS